MSLIRLALILVTDKLRRIIQELALALARPPHPAEAFRPIGDSKRPLLYGSPFSDSYLLSDFLSLSLRRVRDRASKRYDEETRRDEKRRNREKRNFQESEVQTSEFDS